MNIHYRLQKIPQFLWVMNIHYRLQKSQSSTQNDVNLYLITVFI